LHSSDRTAWPFPFHDFRLVPVGFRRVCVFARAMRPLNAPSGRKQFHRTVRHAHILYGCPLLFHSSVELWPRRIFGTKSRRPLYAGLQHSI
jgi:hypothetical protein